jgi:hypothetical protein
MQHVGSANVSTVLVKISKAGITAVVARTLRVCPADYYGVVKILSMGDGISLAV